jgi:Cys-rich protein (TIGR01571 family)
MAHAFVGGIMNGGQPALKNPTGFQKTLCQFTEDMSYCVDSAMFPYCVLGWTKWKLTKGTELGGDGVPGMDCFHTLCPLFGDTYCGCLGMCLALHTCLRRRDIVQKYGIQEDCPASFCTSFCCPCCSLSQVQYEMRARGDYPGGLFLPAPPQTLQSMAAHTTGNFIGQAVHGAFKPY